MHPRKELSVKQVLSNPRSGFTLLELMVTLIVSALVVASVYGVYTSSSEGMEEATAKAQVIPQAQVAMAELSGLLLSAGAFASPDSKLDENSVRAAPGASAPYIPRILSMYQVGDNQNRAIGFQTLPTNQDGTEPIASSDELIFVTARSFPNYFIVEDLQGSGQRIDRAFSSVRLAERGTRRLAKQPFDTSVTDPSAPEMPAGYNGALFAQKLLEGSPMSGMAVPKVMLRLTDREGYSQYAPIDTIQMTNVSSVMNGMIAENAFTPGSVDLVSLNIQFVSGQGPLIQAPELIGGIERTRNVDDGYVAAFLEVFRVGSCIEGNSDENVVLVLEQLNPKALFDSASAELPAPFALPAARCQARQSEMVAGEPLVFSQEVLVRNLVDFQMWFDCGNSGRLGSRMTQLSGQHLWAAPEPVAGPFAYDGSDMPDPGSISNHNCVLMPSVATATQPADTMSTSGADVFRARVAHIRLSVRSDRERQREHVGFQKIVGIELLSDLDPSQVDSSPGLPLSTIDLNSDPSNSASVVTFQNSVVLNNIVPRNRIDPFNFSP